MEETTVKEKVYPPTSAIIIEIPQAEDYISHWRNLHDPTTKWGVPAHITLLFPFIVPTELTEADKTLLGEVVATVEPFSIELDSLGEFPGVLWLNPNPVHRIVRFTHVLWEAFPQAPPYGGAFDKIHPHVTVAMTVDEESHAELRAEINAELAPNLPIIVPVTHVTLSIPEENGAWRRSRFYPLKGVES